MTARIRLSGDASPPQLAAADLAVGEIVAQRELHLDAQMFAQFAALTGDAHPIHYDDDYAKRQGHAAPVAHGLLLVAISALGATALSAQLHDAMVAMLSVEASFQRPVHLNDTVRCTYRVDHIEAKRNNRSTVGITVNIETVDGHNGTLSLPRCVVRLQFLLKTNLEESPHA
ncbi:MAG: MaoC family dehydratase N-terminal domain-containing protein [Pigmentiphaga sp.]|nr:MaoC family dehydratase N-terminal domain-containing protein [Pigmentiphaga sp.]